MKQLLVLSGKGGTGKTTISSALIDLLHAKAYGDCDVDAPNLHLVVPESGLTEKKPFFGMDIFHINPDKCINCGLCLRECRFHAIEILEGKHHINPLKCEGCAFCAEICPLKAITPIKNETGYTQITVDRDTLFSTARLHIGKGNSGLLVSEVKKPIEAFVDRNDLAILDGSPGIGCPVIASIRGVDYVLIVTEPSISALHDMERLLKTINHFNVPCAVCINKCDVSLTVRDKIIEFCKKKGLDILGSIPYDQRVVKSLNTKKRMLDIPGPFTSAIITLSQNIQKWMKIV